MKELTLVVQVQTYGEDEDEVLDQIRNTLVSVVSLCDVAVGTFTVSDIREADDVEASA